MKGAKGMADTSLEGTDDAPGTRPRTVKKYVTPGDRPVARYEVPTTGADPLSGRADSWPGAVPTKTS